MKSTNITVSQDIHNYTSGYPYLISAICKILDEELLENSDFESLTDVWTERGITEAVKILLKDNIPLFDSMVKQLDLYKDLRNMIEEIFIKEKGFRLAFR